LAGPKNSSFHDNEIYNNRIGIRLFNAFDNEIYNNIIRNNSEYGINIELMNAQRNKIYHNNLIDNTQNADDLHNNTWHNGYPSGGNYWSDYNGNDMYHGPNQDLLGSDGISDTPYYIAGGSNVDSYPLMYPYGCDTTSPITIKIVGEPKMGEFVTESTPFNLTAYDNESGVNAIYYRIWHFGWSNWTVYTGNFTLQRGGLHYLEYYSIDNAGNIEALHNQTHYVTVPSPKALPIPFMP